MAEKFGIGLSTLRLGVRSLLASKGHLLGWSTGYGSQRNIPKEEIVVRIQSRCLG